VLYKLLLFIHSFIQSDTPLLDIGEIIFLPFFPFYLHRTTPIAHQRYTTMRFTYLLTRKNKRSSGSQFQNQFNNYSAVTRYCKLTKTVLTTNYFPGNHTRSPLVFSFYMYRPSYYGLWLPDINKLIIN